ARTPGRTLSSYLSVSFRGLGSGIEEGGARFAPSAAGGQRASSGPLEASVDLLPDDSRAHERFRWGGGGRVRVVGQPPVGGLDVLTGPEATTREVGAGAQVRPPIRVRRPHDEVGGPVERVPNLDERIGVPLAQSEVERLLERPGPSLAHLVGEFLGIQGSSRGRRSTTVHGDATEAGYIRLRGGRGRTPPRTKGC